MRVIMVLGGDTDSSGTAGCGDGGEAGEGDSGVSVEDVEGGRAAPESGIADSFCIRGISAVAATQVTLAAAA
jgi:hypothetical protein